MEVTQERVNLFADATDDHQWIHVDPARAKQGPFGAPIAHGYLTLSLVNRFLPQIVEVRGISMGVNYGVDRVRFPAPVKVGVAHARRRRARRGRSRRRTARVQAKVRVTVEIEGGERSRPAWRRRSAATTRSEERARRSRTRAGVSTLGRRGVGSGSEESLPMLSRANMLILAYGVATAGAVGTVGFSALSLGLPTGLFFALLADGIARPGSNVFYPTVTHGPRGRKRVALSFDDGPDPEVTPAVLDALAKHGARATFFSIGQIAGGTSTAGTAHRRGRPRARQSLLAAFALAELLPRGRTGPGDRAWGAGHRSGDREPGKATVSPADRAQESSARTGRPPAAADAGGLVAAQPRHAHHRSRADRATRAAANPAGRHRADA